MLLIPVAVFWTLYFKPVIASVHPDFHHRWIHLKKSIAMTTTSEMLQEFSSSQLLHCTQACLENPFCIAVIFNGNYGRCLLRRRSTSGNLTTIERNSLLYEVQFVNSFQRKYPASCSEVKKCSPLSTDGEYWLYPEKFNGQVPVKTYCHMMTSSETAEEYITLPNATYSVRKDFLHLINNERCSRSSEPLMRTYFDKIRIDITSLGVVQNEFTFATTTGVSSESNVNFGIASDCTAEAWWENTQGPCGLEAEFKIDLRGSGAAIEDSVQWVVTGWSSEIRNFSRTTDSTQVSCLVIGWCGECRPNGTIVLTSLYETVDDTAQLITCQ